MHRMTPRSHDGSRQDDGRSRTETHRPFTAIVLAAGEGTRMRSAPAQGAARVGGPLACSAMSLAAVRAAGRRRGSRSWSGRDRRMSRPRSRPRAPARRSIVQAERLGTAHAVLAARERWRQATTTSSSPSATRRSSRPETLRAPARAARGRRRGRRRSASRPRDPTGYGRFLTQGGELVAIREEKDASAERARDHASAMPA